MGNEVEEISMEDFRQAMLDDAREESNRQYQMQTDIDYRLSFVDDRSKIEDSLRILKDICYVYNLDFDEVLNEFKDGL